MARLNKILNRNNKTTGSLNSIRKQNGELTNSPKETLIELARILIPDDGQPYNTDKIQPDISMVMKITAPN